MRIYVNYDGKILEADQPFITAGNRGFCYGDGLFETMRAVQGRVELAAWHFERLFEGMRLLGFAIPGNFTPGYFEEQTAQLCKKNGHEQGARVRLMVFRGDAGDSLPHYVIQSSALPLDNSLNEQGLWLGLYEDARKAIDKFSHLKSNNYQPYTLAALHAQQNAWDDVLVMNTAGNICESSIANIFIIKDGIVITPSLKQGCVAGIMRRNLLLKLPVLGYKVKEDVLTVEMIREADELFLTNAVRGIRWVQKFEGAVYKNKIIADIYNAINS